MNKLKEYLFFKNKSITDFAEEIQISRSYINLITRGKVVPSKFLAREIERFTNGEVKADDLLAQKVERKKEKTVSCA